MPEQSSKHPVADFDQIRCPESREQLIAGLRDALRRTELTVLKTTPLELGAREGDDA